MIRSKDRRIREFEDQYLEYIYKKTGLKIEYWIMKMDIFATNMEICAGNNPVRRSLLYRAGGLAKPLGGPAGPAGRSERDLKFRAARGRAEWRAVCGAPPGRTPQPGQAIA